MLTGIHPLLTGPLLDALDTMGHSDAVVLADAHFPAARVAAAGTPARRIDLPAVGTPELLAAVRTVVPLDDIPVDGEPPVDLMATADGSRPPVFGELLAAAGTEDARLLDRVAFYRVASAAFVVVRTGETRSYGNVILRKGLVVPAR